MEDNSAIDGGGGWVVEAARVFEVKKPQHFTNHTHCCECTEHDEVLRAHDRDTIGIEQLGNPGWDPMCLCTVEGFQYYFPALVRLCLDRNPDALLSRSISVSYGIRWSEQSAGDRLQPAAA